MEQDFDLSHWKKECPKHNCRSNSSNECGLQYVFIPASMGSDAQGEKFAPKNGAYKNSIVQYEVNGAVYIYSCEGIPVNVKEGE